MATHLDCVVDANDASRLSRFWSEATGWAITYQDAAEIVVEPPEGDPGMSLVFVTVPEAKQGKNRIHLDLASASLEAQQEMVTRLVALGASRVDVGQGEVAWVVLADPEGNEFCVLEPREGLAGTGPVAAVVAQVADPPAQATFWSAATGWPVVAHRAGLSMLRGAPASGPVLAFVATSEPKTVKNRLHVDVAPGPDDDHGAEVERLVGLGATRADIGQRDVSWVVLADPEGHEFCVLTSR